MQDKSSITMRSHIVIRDKETGEIILNQSDTPSNSEIINMMRNKENKQEKV